MRNALFILFIAFLFSCDRQRNEGEKYITVSIEPFKYFVEAIAGADFNVNVMVPAGADPHIYEPFPDQINKLRRSSAYISDGYLGFEMTWLDRFYGINRTMKKLSLGDKIDPLATGQKHEGEHVEAADPHYWMSLKCGITIALSVKELLCELNPQHEDIYKANYDSLVSRIEKEDIRAKRLFSGLQNKSFMIFHPNMAYLARDYGLEEIPLEFEGKEPSPSRMKELIDIAREKDISTIFVQREYDTKNAKAIAAEIGAQVKIIDPLSGDWLNTLSDTVDAIYLSISEKSK